MTPQQIKDNAPEGATHYSIHRILNLNGPVHVSIVYYKIKRRYKCIFRRNVWQVEKRDFLFHELIKPL